MLEHCGVFKISALNLTKAIQTIVLYILWAKVDPQIQPVLFFCPRIVPGDRTAVEMSYKG